MLPHTSSGNYSQHFASLDRVVSRVHASPDDDRGEFGSYLEKIRREIEDGEERRADARQREERELDRKAAKAAHEKPPRPRSKWLKCADANGKYKCPLCDKQPYTVRESFYSHLRKNHSINPTDPDQMEGGAAQ